jgi:hypothetical protein
MRTVAHTVIALLVGAAGSAQGQDRPLSLYPGSVLRITVANQPSAAPITGTLFRSDDDGLVVRHAGDTVRVPWAEVARLEIGRAVSHRRTGAILGAVGGLVVGATIGYAAAGDCDNEGWFFSGDSCRYLVTAGLGGLGVIAGAVVGASIGNRTTQRWEDIPMPGFRVTVAPRGQGFVIGARVGF